MSTREKVGIVGFGYIGSVIGAVLANRGYSIIALEKDPRIIKAVQEGVAPFSEKNLQEYLCVAREQDLITISDDPTTFSEVTRLIITVGTPLRDDFSADVSDLDSACQEIAPYVVDDALVVVKSTVPPGITRSIVAGKLPQAHVAFCPERLAEGNAIHEFETIPIVIGGVTAEAGMRAMDFFDEAVGVETILVASSEAAEMVKLADNLWIDINIALANELALLCHKLGIDVLDVIRAANSLPKGQHHVNILLPSVGVGGYCLTKDPWFVADLGHKNDLDLKLPVAARETNDRMPIRCAHIVEDQLRELCPNKRPEQIKIAVMGIAFKNDTGDCRYSPTKPFINELLERGYQVEIYDPLVASHDALMVTDHPLADSIESALKDADCVAFLAAHKELRAITADTIARYAPGSLVFDGRRYFSSEEIANMRQLGLSYRGVGR
ncbi:MAG: nucleotide sugar dehydrogenase [Coriobacteriia bacterium]|nr:nucleotide sugar dehydrogenase [Coriobacteriia bacterium]